VTRFRVVAAATAIAIATSAALIAPAVAQTKPAPRVAFDEPWTHTGVRYYTPVLNMPANMVSPVNYAAQPSRLDFTVTAKKSTLPVNAQICMWRVNFTIETCSPRIQFTKTGTYSLTSTPTRWWRKNGVWDWTKKPDFVRILLSNTRGQMMNSRLCGQVCFTPKAELPQHLPISFHAKWTLSV
jgi:hypothetical protein